LKAHIEFIFDEKVNWLRQIHINKDLNQASITCRTVKSLIADIRKRIKDHNKESIKVKHDVIINVAVDVAVNVTVNVNVVVVVSWWKSEEYESEIAWEKSSLYIQI